MPTDVVRGALYVVPDDACATGFCLSIRDDPFNPSVFVCLLFLLPFVRVHEYTCGFPPCWLPVGTLPRGGIAAQMLDEEEGIDFLLVEDTFFFKNSSSTLPSPAPWETDLPTSPADPPTFSA